MTDMTPDPRREVVQAIYDHCGRGEWAQAEALLTADFFVSEGSTMPYAGVFRGKGALRQLMETVFGMMDIAALDVHAITVGGDYAVGVLDVVLAGDERERIPVAEIFRFRDGKVCEIRPHYFDPAPVTAAVARRAAR
jgi:ketosteroid isomerase-like protein